MCLTLGVEKHIAIKIREKIQTNNSTHRFTRPLDSRFFEQNVNNTQKAKYRNSSTPALPPVLRKNLLCIHLLLIFPRQSFSVPSSEIIKKDSIMFLAKKKKKNCDSFLLPNEENDDGREKNSFLSERGERGRCELEEKETFF